MPISDLLPKTLLFLFGLIALSSSEGSAKLEHLQRFTTAFIACMYTQSMDIDEDSDQTLDL